MNDVLVGWMDGWKRCTKKQNHEITKMFFGGDILTNDDDDDPNSNIKQKKMTKLFSKEN